MKSIIYVIIILIFVLGCTNDIKTTILTKDNYKNILQSQHLTSEEKELLLQYVERKGILKDNFNTVEEIIFEQKQWNYEDSLIRTNLNSALNLKLLNKDDIGRNVKITILITNNKDKGIKGLRGILILRDLFGRELSTINIEYYGIIKPEESVKYQYEYEKRLKFMFSKSYKKVVYKLEDYELNWQPIIIVFEDGEKLQHGNLNKSSDESSDISSFLW